MERGGTPWALWVRGINAVMGKTGASAVETALLSGSGRTDDTFAYLEG